MKAFNPACQNGQFGLAAVVAVAADTCQWQSGQQALEQRERTVRVYRGGITLQEVQRLSHTRRRDRERHAHADVRRAQRAAGEFLSTRWPHPKTPCTTQAHGFGMAFHYQKNSCKCLLN